LEQLMTRGSMFWSYFMRNDLDVRRYEWNIWK